MQKTLITWCKRYLSNREAVAILTIFIVSLLAIHFLRSILTPIIASIIIAYMLLPLVKKLKTLKIPHVLAVTIVFLLFLGIFLLLLLWVLPMLWEQFMNLFATFPDLIAKGQSFFLNLHSQYPKIVSLEQLQQMASGLQGQLTNLGKFIISFSLLSITQAITAVVYLVLVPLLIFFFLKDSTAITNWLKKFLPQKASSLNQIWAEVDTKIGSYIKGKIIEILIVAVVTIVTFLLLQLPYSILLGFLVGVSVIIPYIGVVIVTIPICLIAFLEWGFGSQFFYLLLAYVVIITLDANILVPMLFSEALSLHPVAIILGILLFGALGGFWGIFFAIPLVILVNSLIKFWPKTE